MYIVLLTETPPPFPNHTVTQLNVDSLPSFLTYLKMSHFKSSQNLLKNNWEISLKR